MSSETIDDTLTNDLSGLRESIREKVLTKFLKLKAAEEAIRLQDQQALTAHSRRKADRYLDEMLPATTNEESDVGDIIIADDISITGAADTESTPVVKETSSPASAVPAPPPVQKTSLVKPLVKYGLATALGGLGGAGLSVALDLLSPTPPAATSPADTDTRLEPYIPTSQKNPKK